MRNKTREIVIKRENSAVFGGLCILIVITISIAACTSSDSGTNNPVNASTQPIPTSIVQISKITEPATTTVQVVQPIDTDNQTQILIQQSEEPVSITINSARKQLGLGKWGVVYTEPVQGNVYLVLNISMKNNDAPEGFVFTNSSLAVWNLDRGTVTNRPFRLRQSLRKYLENPFTLPATVKQYDAINGQILFEVNDSEHYRVDLVDDNKNIIASRPVSFDNLFTTDNPLGITIHSATLLPEFNSSMPHPVSPMGGRFFLILNVTIKNNGIKEGFVFDFTSTTIEDPTSGYYLSHSFNNVENMTKNLEKPILLPITIGQNKSVTGQILFSMPVSEEYRLNLIDTNKTIIASRIVNAG
jgi:hypothetical protein